MIPETPPYNNYTGDGVTTQFDFDFYIESASQLVVSHTASDSTITTLVKDTDYSIHEIGNENGSYITFPIAGSTYSVLSSSEVITLQLSLPISQQSEYGTSSELDLESLEYSFDYLTRIAQIQNRQLQRSIKVAEGSDIETDELSRDLIIVADNINQVNTVSTNINNVNTTATNISSVNTVSGSIANVNATGSNISNVNAVAGNATNINAVNVNKTNINTVAGSISNVNTTATNISKVNTVGTDLALGNNSLIKKVNDNKTNIDAVAGNATNINAVNANKTNINTVAGNNSNITTCAGNDSNITTCATNISAITAAPSYANSASASASIATSKATIATEQADLARQYAEETHGQSDVMVENVRAIPAYTNYTYNQTETKGLADLKAWNRSTFDRSKFTVVGSPAITADGIASGLSQSNRLEIPFNSSGKTNFKIKVPFKFPTTMTLGGNIVWGDSGIGSYCYGTKSYQPNLLGTGVNAFGGSQDLQINIDYVLEMSVENNTSCKFEIIRKDTNTTVATKSWETNRSAEISKIYISQLSNVSIDLKQFSIRVDGIEVFNGNKSGIDQITSTLSIPYNQSKTGCKIVDSYYRSRVQDMYEQFGWANYYTLSDTDFTVPQGENLDGHVAVVDWYKNGVTSWEYDTNLDCIETGSCTSGTAVTLPKAFADTNYSLSVPYSAKTATGFTPSATGEYIAKGKITLG